MPRPPQTGQRRNAFDTVFRPSLPRPSPVHCCSRHTGFLPLFPENFSGVPALPGVTSKVNPAHSDLCVGVCFVRNPTKVG